jgi:hypothetical protein
VPPTDRAEDEYVDLLLTAEAVVVGHFMTASNATLLVALRGEDGEVPELDEGADVTDLDPRRFAVYKPEAGERPLWDFSDGTLWRREVAACVVDRALGLDMVPTTVGRDDLDMGVGALQRFVPHDPEEHYFVLRDDPGLRAQLRRMVVFDVLLDNADRKGGHVLLERVDGERRIRLIDHGVCFHTHPHLRTVAWDFGGEPLRDEERELGAALAALLEEGHPAVAALESLLDGRELERLLERAHGVARTTHFPVPSHDRQYPWPLL